MFFRVTYAKDLEKELQKLQRLNSVSGNFDNSVNIIIIIFCFAMTTGLKSTSTLIIIILNNL